MIIADCLTDDRALAGALLSLGIRMLVNVPILVRGRLTALVYVHYERPHPISDKEILFMRTVADRTQAAWRASRPRTNDGSSTASCRIG